jgi:hypothetical protein
VALMPRPGATPACEALPKISVAQIGSDRSNNLIGCQRPSR